MILQHHLSVERITDGPKHHFFGYFDKFPWDKSGKRILAQETAFTARQPVPGEKAVIGIIENKVFTPVAETDSWCWQQGCMLQWLNDADNKIIYNDREGDYFAARILDLSTGKTETLCRPIYCLSPDGRRALSLNFARLDRERPGYGYPGAVDPNKDKDHPDDEGIWLVDLKKNKAELVVSYDRLVREFPYEGENNMNGVKSWVNHILFSPDSRRFAFFHRWRCHTNGGWLTHMFTANIDGTDLYPLNLQDFSSHYTWFAPDRIINYSSRDIAGHQYYDYTDRTGKIDIVGRDVFPGDGHCSYSSNGKWMLTDSYPQPDSTRRLYLYDLAGKQAYEIGSFYSDPAYPPPTRCDLHPNWSRDDRFVCIDSIHEGSRQMYLLDVSGFTRS